MVAVANQTDCVRLNIDRLRRRDAVRHVQRVLNVAPLGNVRRFRELSREGLRQRAVGLVLAGQDIDPATEACPDRRPLGRGAVIFQGEGPAPRVELPGAVAFDAAGQEGAA